MLQHKKHLFQSLNHNTAYTIPYLPEYVRAQDRGMLAMLRKEIKKPIIRRRQIWAFVEG